jgi:peptidoglycan/xylan/chitin deacetylase (PgdA/CDA1 family)
MLHRIVPDSDRLRIHNPVNEITPEKLEELIRFYRQNEIDIISFDQLPAYLAGNSEYFVIFTFDDGYRDNYLYALPVFERYNAPFTVYVTTGFPERTISIWWYQLEEILLKNTKVKFRWGKQSRVFDCEECEQKEASFDAIRQIIIQTPFKEQQINLVNAFEDYIDDPFRITNNLAMGWEDIKAMAASPLVTIGAHTVNHPALNQLSETEIVEECLRSREILESKIGKPVDHFSYPFGSAMEVGARECDLVGKLGFKTATTTRIGSIFKEHTKHVHCLPRIPIKPDINLSYLESIISGRGNFLRGAKKRVVTL